MLTLKRTSDRASTEIRDVNDKEKKEKKETEKKKKVYIVSNPFYSLRLCRSKFNQGRYPGIGNVENPRTRLKISLIFPTCLHLGIDRLVNGLFAREVALFFPSLFFFLFSFLIRTRNNEEKEDTVITFYALQAMSFHF